MKEMRKFSYMTTWRKSILARGTAGVQDSQWERAELTQGRARTLVWLERSEGEVLTGEAGELQRPYRALKSLQGLGGWL